MSVPLPSLVPSGSLPYVWHTPCPGVPILTWLPHTCDVLPHCSQHSCLFDLTWPLFIFSVDYFYKLVFAAAEECCSPSYQTLLDLPADPQHHVALSTSEKTESTHLQHQTTVGVSCLWSFRVAFCARSRTMGHLLYIFRVLSILPRHFQPCSFI